jgi:hypothetical protein
MGGKLSNLVTKVIISISQLAAIQITVPKCLGEAEFIPAPI